ncbi:MAG: four helix bundle protein [Bacteroidetes bacterium]|nr:four helix bundle protein [Bacteroidota bacterium]
MQTKAEFTNEIKQRTNAVAVQIFKFCEALPFKSVHDIAIKQIVKSSTSVAANYRAVCRARSKAEFFAKLSIVVEEADETIFWLEFLTEVAVFKSSFSEPLILEMNKLTALFATARKNTNN